MADTEEFKAPSGQSSLLNSEPANWPEAVTATGDSAVDQVLGGLDELPETPIDEHPASYQRLHDELLAELESGPGNATT
ncbi:hypothetical protein [Psychromicrobium lacuslunae]|uniref:Uncharacterized protein n=1 Tax=Psychromicrobium lacuslunae TaxID=1618207 RepID=A0A0D4BX03_9MICC|nr:hypothetical protein [Psychromicrobium lacuslunae]AJT40645.1 hypothetical protein UM93_02260 [Psychromicrobium lacuslunae]